MLKNPVILIVLSLGLGFLSRSAGLNFYQATSIAIFSASILGTLFFSSGVVGAFIPASL